MFSLLKLSFTTLRAKRVTPYPRPSSSTFEIFSVFTSKILIYNSASEASYHVPSTLRASITHPLLEKNLENKGKRFILGISGSFALQMSRVIHVRGKL